MSSTEMPSLKKRVIAGAAWSVAMRWTITLLGIFSAAILARLLQPEDYGLVAISMALVGLCNIFFGFGVELAVLRNADAGPTEFNTAWTIRLIQSTVVCVLIFSLGSKAAEFYGDPRLTHVFYINAIGVLLMGFENIGILRFRKELEFGKDYRFNVASKVLSVFTTVLLAFYFRNYFALVIGSALHSFYSVALSYVVVKYRPRFTLEGWREMWDFSKWILVKNFANYVNGTGHQLVLAKLLPLEVVGFYKWGLELNRMSFYEILAPMRRSLMPGFVKISHDKRYLAKSYLRSQNALSTIAVPFALGFGCVAEELVPIYLGGGDKWTPVIPIIQILAGFAFFNILQGAAGNIIVVLGYVRHTAYSDVGRAILLGLLLYPAYKLNGINGVACVLVFISSLSTLYYFLVLRDVGQVRLRDSIAANIRPTVAGLVMALGVISYVAPAGAPLLSILLVKTIIGALLYITTLLVLWLTAGKPNGIEADVLSVLSKRTAEFFKRVQ